jgi:hypothetical protein
MTNREKAKVMESPYYINNKRDKILSTTTNETVAYAKKNGKWTSDDPDLRELIILYRDGSTIGGLISVMRDALTMTKQEINIFLKGD